MSEQKEMTLAEIQESVEKINKRVGEIDNLARTNETLLTEEIAPALKEANESLQVLNMAMQNLFFTQSQDQILIESVVRYLAGYEVGDFSKEMQEVEQLQADGKEIEGFTVKPKNEFNAKRFYDLAEEVGKTFAEMRKKKMEEARAKALAKQKEANKPHIQIVKDFPRG